MKAPHGPTLGAPTRAITVPPAGGAVPPGLGTIPAASAGALPSKTTIVDAVLVEAATPTTALAAVVQGGPPPVAHAGTALVLAADTGLTTRAAVADRVATIKALFAEASATDKQRLAATLVFPSGVPEALAHNDPALKAILTQLSREFWLASQTQNGDFEILLAIARAMLDKLRACRVQYPDYTLSAASVGVLYLLCDVPEEVIPHADRTRLVRVLFARLPRVMVTELLEEPMTHIAHLAPTVGIALLALRHEVEGDQAPTQATSREEDAQTPVMLGRLRDPDGRTPVALREAVAHVVRTRTVEAIPLLRDLRAVVEQWQVPWHHRGLFWWRNQQAQLLAAITAALSALAVARETLAAPVPAVTAVVATPGKVHPPPLQREQGTPVSTAEIIALSGVDASGARLYPDLVRLPDGEFHRRVNPDDPYWTIADPSVTTVISGVFMGTTTITNAMWNEYLRAIKKKDQRGLPERFCAHQPAVNILWGEATAYCQWLTMVLQAAGHAVTVQLPSDEEWEYAARAGREENELLATASGVLDSTQAHYGQDWDNGAPIAADAETVPPIPFVDPISGAVALLQQMAGNVWEWTRSVFQSDFDTRSVRGGSWADYEARAFRASSRGDARRINRYKAVGFRVVALQDSKKST